MWMFVALLQEISTLKICWLLGHGASLAVKRGMGCTGGKDWCFGRLKSLNKKMDPMKYTLEYWKWTFLNPKSRWMEDVLQPLVFVIAPFLGMHFFPPRIKRISSKSGDIPKFHHFFASSPLIHHNSPTIIHGKKTKEKQKRPSQNPQKSSQTKTSSSMVRFTYPRIWKVGISDTHP